MVDLTPEALAELEKRKVISPAAANVAKARLLQLDARAGLLQGGLGQMQGGFTPMLAPQMGGGMPMPGVAPPPPPSAAPTPVPVVSAPRPQPKKLAPKPKQTPQQKADSNAWLGLASKVVWGKPTDLPGQGVVSVHTIGSDAYNLLVEQYPEKAAAGLAPVGWANPDKFSDEEKSVLARLIVMQENARAERRRAEYVNNPERAKQLIDEYTRAGVPLPPELNEFMAPSAGGTEPVR